MAENTSPKLDLELTLAQHPAAHVRNVLAAVPRAFAVIAVQDADADPTDAAPIPPLELLALVEDEDDLRDLAELFTILGDATRAAADQMEAQSTTGEEA